MGSMKVLRFTCVFSGFLSLALSLFGQAASVLSASAQVPPLIQFSNVATDEGGNPISGVANITVSLYATQQSGEPLWTETQNNVQLDLTGHYSVQLGITKPNGVPIALFSTGEARWLGVRIGEQAEQARVLLLSVPYALKAGDAATIGGLPPSAFLLAAPPSGGASVYISEPAIEPSVPPPSATDVTTTGGTVNFLPRFSGTSTILDSVLFQSAASPFKIGVNTTTPATTLDVKGAGTIRGVLALPATAAATAAKGADSQPLNLVASAFNSTSSAALNQTFQWQAEPASNDTTTPSGTLNLLFGEGATKPSETGLRIASNGHITFSAGQTFPGAGDGTITGVTAGTDLTGGGTSGRVTLNVDTTKVPQLAAFNVFTNDQEINGDVIATSSNQGLIGNATAVGSEGVVGQSPDIGVFGISSGNSQTGLEGGSAGVWGDTGAASNTGHAGILGTADANSAGWFRNNGPFATVLATNAAPYESGAYGVAAQSNFVGVYGVVSEASMTASLIPPEAGLWGDTGLNDTGAAAVFGTADDGFGGYFVNNGTDAATLVANNLTAASPTAPVFLAIGRTGSCTINVSGEIVCSGSNSAVVAVDGGSRKVALYAIEGAENWFEDIGSGELSNGSGRVELDPTFAQTVNPEVGYHVFLTPNGDSEGLYVSNKTAQGFEVHEQRGGTSSIAFDYRIIGKRRGYENVRLADKTKQFSDQEIRLKQRRRPAQPSTSLQVTPAAPVKRFRAVAHSMAAPPK